jgi:ubiquitin-conjugating enzyme E2 M
LFYFAKFTDISDLDGGTVAQVEFPNPNDLTNFSVIVSPDSGCWLGAKYHFTFAIPPLYPHEPPKVTCNTKIYHPNINLEGAVCLNILREDWKPVLDINAVIYGLIYLFYEPNPDDPLNREAADLYRSDKAQFARVVKRTLQGMSHAGESFPKLI